MKVKVNNGRNKGQIGLGNDYYQQTHCKRGHEFSEANTAYQASGARKCKACHALKQREYMERKNEQTV